jgi:hypothetical protein
MFRKIFIVFLFLTVIACNSNSDSNDYTELNQIAIDTTNDRLFLSQTPGQMFVLTASTGESLSGDEPFVTENNDATTHALLPSLVSQMGAYATGTTSRLFILGGLDDGTGTTVFNQILVLDFDGTSFAESATSPITISDGDDATDETNNSFGDLKVDQTNGLVFVTDTGAGLLYVFDAADGTQAVAPIVIAGAPKGLALDNNYLYVGNTSATADEDVITVINLTDYSTTQIDLDIACDRLAVLSSAAGTVLIAKDADTSEIYLHTVDTTTHADSTAITSASSDYASGVLTSEAGVESTIADLVLIEGTDGLVYGYLSELDGNIEFLTFASDLSSYSLETISTTVSNITYGAPFPGQDIVYFITETGALLDIPVGEEDVNTDY